jgi:CelD/BcsL family acetyltransferase involved in cellulose biosynthesis
MSILVETGEISTVEGLDSIKAEWSRLFEACPSSTPFQSPEWLIPWWKSFGQGTLMALTMRVAGELRGLAPMCVIDGKVRLVGSGISDYLGFLLDPSIEDAGIEAFFGHLARRGGWISCVLQDLRPSSALLSMRPPDGLSAILSPGVLCLGVDLPHTIDAFRDRKGTMSGFKKAWKRLSGNGIRAEAAAGEGEARSFMATLVRLHTERWKAVGKSGVLRGAQIRSFHEETAVGFQKKGMLWLYKITMDGRELSVLYGFVHRRRLYAYLMGFDPEFSFLSPGRLLLLSAAEDCIRRGVYGIDFLRGGEKYKYDWSPSETRNYNLTIKKDI